MLEHGGRLRQAAARYGIPLDAWLDLSTGINPAGYAVPPIPVSAWQRLPEDDDELERAAAVYYGTQELLPVAGSQAAIQALPRVLPGRRVSLLAPGYAEHAHAWRERTPSLVIAEEMDRAVNDSDVVVLIHPNNPTGACFEKSRLLDWHARLAARGGWLVVDEAFIDADPANSLARNAGQPGLVVLRSLGKFFGLAGARVGFVLAPPALRAALAEILGPWPISGPARYAAGAALSDQAWQIRMLHTLKHSGDRLAALLIESGLRHPKGPALFKWVPHPRAAALHASLARQGILGRLFESPSALRFGLPPNEAGWRHLRQGLEVALLEIG